MGLRVDLAAHPLLTEIAAKRRAGFGRLEFARQALAQGLPGDVPLVPPSDRAAWIVIGA